MGEGLIQLYCVLQLWIIEGPCIKWNPLFFKMYLLFFTPCLLLNLLQSVPTTLQELLLLGSVASYWTNPTSIFVIMSLWHLTLLLILEIFSSYNFGVTFCFSAHICGPVSLMELFHLCFKCRYSMLPKGVTSALLLTLHSPSLISSICRHSNITHWWFPCQESRLLSWSI